jgi:glutamate dehydrogenase
VLLSGSAEPDKLAEEGKEQYRTLMRGLLDLTDNLDRPGRCLPPERSSRSTSRSVPRRRGRQGHGEVQRHRQRGLGGIRLLAGRRLRSGGSHGYDHKEVGITAKGAWECVKRHFREKGKDIQSEPFTVVGIGDMSGDVFGNGMLLSRQIRLVAAFDHRHIFLDPDPDAERSFVERAAAVPSRALELGRLRRDRASRRRR